ncbi:MSHA biogenesis protein MshF [Shewanella putrefaciens]|nr:hypothetical protein [Shewanella putrefaciens]AVV84028.1 MSHA biogenesis protein MshF [Shewanella putrefaciens]
MLTMMAIIGIKYFSTMPQLAARGLELEHTRFLNIVAMVRSQWLSLGKPSQMNLDWEIFDNQNQQLKPSVVKMNPLVGHNLSNGITKVAKRYGNS